MKTLTLLALAGTFGGVSSLAVAQSAPGASPPSASTTGAGSSSGASGTVGTAGSGSAGGTSASTIGLGGTSTAPSGSSSTIGGGGSAATTEGKATTSNKINENPNGLHDQARARAQDGGTWSRSATDTRIKNDELTSRTRTMSHEPGGPPAKSTTTETLPVQK